MLYNNYIMNMSKNDKIKLCISDLLSIIQTFNLFGYFLDGLKKKMYKCI